MLSLYEIQGEALQVSKRIFQEMHDDVENNGGTFYLIVLPTNADIIDFRKENEKSVSWARGEPNISFESDRSRSGIH